MTEATEPHPALALGEVRRMLPYVSLEYSARSELRTDFDGALTWAVHAEANFPSPHLASTPMTVLTMRGVTLDLSIGTDYAEFLDATSADLAHFMALFDETANLDMDAISAALEEDFGCIGNRVVIIDYVHVPRRVRGHGVGRLLIAAALRTFFDDVAVIATYPEPFEDNDDATSQRYLRAKTSLERTWSSLGFTAFREGVWIKDPAFTNGEEHLTEVRRHLLT